MKKINEGIKALFHTMEFDKENSVKEINYLMNELVNTIKQTYGYYVNFEMVPKGEYMVENFPLNEFQHEEDRIGIVIQGPICHENDFTINTIKLYKKLFNEPLIIVSTWEDEETDAIASSIDDIHILKNPRPKNNGVQNSNMQIASTIAGLKELSKSSVKYALKTRTDQRVTVDNIQAFLIELLHAFTLKESITNQVSRIITIDKYTDKFAPFHLSDMFQFGAINDLLDFWSVPFTEQTFDVSTLASKILYESTEILKEQDLHFPELYLTTRYAREKLGEDYNYDYHNYFKFIAERTIVIDCAMIGLIWHKKLDNYRYLQIATKKELLSQVITFKDWFLLYQECINTDEFNKNNIHNLSVRRHDYRSK